MEEKIKLICDRVEEGIAVLLPDDGTDGIYHIPSAELTAFTGEETTENNCYFCVIRGGTIVSAEKTVNEAAGENQKRLAALFKKSADRHEANTD